ncbi:MAG: 4-hydroxy-tetrahydrodipicolinate reductase [Candidatus Eremiobacteraeota bacterium]|nr:4-hydroxy-tetrahydrodipicolinate reductase [Candidatus Eremiobacteraeota bacterium]
MIRVGIAGANGKMGALTATTLQAADDIEYVGGLVRKGTAQPGQFDDTAAFIAAAKPDVLVDFSLFPDSKRIALDVLERGVRPVIGTSGYGPDDLADIRSAVERTGVGAIFAPNFSVGAVLMMRFALAAAPRYDAVEIVETHESGKKDAPSGTAMATARKLAGSGAFARAETKVIKAPGARGADVSGIGVHSLRLPGIVAQQEVVLGGQGEILSIRHQSLSRQSFMPGVLLAVRAAKDLARFVDGLDELV